MIRSLARKSAGGRRGDLSTLALSIKHFLESIVDDAPRTRQLYWAILACLLLALGRIIAGPATASAQSWTQIGTMPGNAYSAYFFDKDHGVVGGAGFLYTYNSGVWTQPAYPEAAATFKGIRLINGQLYATCGNSDVWVSGDQGSTWSKAGINTTNQDEIYRSNDGALHTIMERGGGTTFLRMDANNCVIVNDDVGPPTYSTDGGISWSLGNVSGFPLPFRGGYTGYADTCRRIYYSTREQGGTLISTDLGINWAPLSGAPGAIDILDGSDGIVYWQTTTGLVVSSDQGATFTNIGGPGSSNEDRRIFAMGPFGKYVIAFHGQEVWQYDNGQTVTIQQPNTLLLKDSSAHCMIARFELTLKQGGNATYHFTLTGDANHTIVTSDTTVNGSTSKDIPIQFSVLPPLLKDSLRVHVHYEYTGSCSVVRKDTTLVLWVISEPPAIFPLACRDTVIRVCAPGAVRIPINARPPWPTQPFLFELTEMDTLNQVQPHDSLISISSPTTIFLNISPKTFGTTIRYRLRVVDLNCLVHIWDTSFTVRLEPPQDALSVNVKPLTLHACDSARLPIILGLITCDSLKIDLVELLDTGNSGSLELLLPWAVGGIGKGLPAKDTLWLNYAPTEADEDIKAHVHLHGHFIPGGGNFDTLIAINVSSISSGPAKAWTIITDKTKPLRTTVCGSAQVPLYFQSPNCQLWRLDSIVSLDPNGIASTGSFASHFVASGSTDTSWITIATKGPGLYSVQIKVHAISMETGDEFDTVLTLQVLGVLDKSSPRIKATTPVTISSCNPSRLPIIISALTCDSVLFSSCALTVPSGITWDSALTSRATQPAWFPRVAQMNTSDTLWLSFPAQSTKGIFAFYVHLQGKYFQSPKAYANFDTLLQLRVTFTGTDATLVSNPSAIVLDTVSTCASLDTMLSFANLGCEAITVTSNTTNWNSGWSIVDPTFPITLQSGTSFASTVHFHPVADGLATQYVTYAFDASSGSRSSEELLVQGVGKWGQAAMSLPVVQKDFGVHEFCKADTLIAIDVQNDGCDVLSLSNAHIVDGVLAPGAFILLNAADTLIAPGQLFQYHVQFASETKAKLDAQLVFHSESLHDATISGDTSIALSAEVISGIRSISTPSQSILFDPTSLCDNRDSMLIIENSGCDTVTLSAAQFSSLSYLLSDTLHFPVVLPPGTHLTVPFQTKLDTSLHPLTNDDAMTVLSNAQEALAPISVSCPIVYPVHFTLSLDAEKAQHAIGELVPVRILRDGVLPLKTKSIEFDIQLDADLLTFDSLATKLPAGSGLHCISESVLPDGRTLLSFRLEPVVDADELASIFFHTSISQQDRSTLDLSNTLFSIEGSMNPGCFATVDEKGSSVDVGLSCGEGLLKRGMLGKLPIEILRVQADRKELRLELESRFAKNTEASIEVIDVLGRQEYRKYTQLQVGSSTIVLNADKLTWGAHFIRIRSNGDVATARVIIDR